MIPIVDGDNSRDTYERPNIPRGYAARELLRTPTILYTLQHGIYGLSTLILDNQDEGRTGILTGSVDTALDLLDVLNGLLPQVGSLTARDETGGQMVSNGAIDGSVILGPAIPRVPDKIIHRLRVHAKVFDPGALQAQAIAASYRQSAERVVMSSLTVAHLSISAQLISTRGEDELRYSMETMGIILFFDRWGNIHTLKGISHSGNATFITEDNLPVDEDKLPKADQEFWKTSANRICAIAL